MLRLQRFTRGMTDQSPTGLASGSQRLHYAWVIVAVASMSGWQNIENGLGMASGQFWGDSSGPGQETRQACWSSRSVQAWLGGYPFWACPVPPAPCSPPGRSSSRLRLARVR
jgi:hypothetical protein